jgi:HlyD family secretion protein
MSESLSRSLASLKIDRTATEPKPSDRGRMLKVGGCAALACIVIGFAAPRLEAAFSSVEVKTVEVMSVSVGSPSTTFTATGYVAAVNTSRLAPKVAGRVVRTHVEQGDIVDAGQLLIELDPTDELASIALAERRLATSLAQIDSERANARVARAELAEMTVRARRERHLVEGGVSSEGSAQDSEGRRRSLERMLRASESKIVVARAQADEFEAAVHVLRTGLRNLSLIAPFRGVVVNEPPRVGEYIGPQPPGVTVDMGGVRIVDLSSLYVDADIPEGRFRLLEPGAPAEIVLDAYPSNRYRGEVSAITPEVDRAKATVRVKVGFIDTAPGVLTDLSARVNFLSKKVDANELAAAPRKVVPAEAVVDHEGSKALFVVEGERVHLRVVKLGATLGNGFVLLEGPPAKAAVVSNPPKGLTDGQRVTLASR